MDRKGAFGCKCCVRFGSRGYVPSAVESCRLRCERCVRCRLQIKAAWCEEHNASPECNVSNKVSDGFWWFLWEVARRDSATVRIFQGTGVSQHPSRSVPCFSTRPRCRHQRQAQVVSWKWTPAFAAASGNFGRVAFERWETLGLQWKLCFHLFSYFFNILQIS